MSEIQVGAEVEWVQRGEVIGLGPGEAVVRMRLSAFPDYAQTLLNLSALTVITPPTPPEPSVGAVVLDAQGDAWQRRADGLWWHARGAGTISESWSFLSAHFAPLTLLVPQETPLAAS